MVTYLPIIQASYSFVCIISFQKQNKCNTFTLSGLLILQDGNPESCKQKNLYHQHLKTNSAETENINIHIFI